MMLLLALACLFTGTMVVAVSALTVYMRADVSTLSETGASPTVIYDRYGKPYEQLSNTREEYVGLSDISPYLQNAVVAIEDERFRHHHGIDLIGIGRAVVTNIVQGDIAQGGSTITQQLAKNKFLSAERTFQRKFVEAVIAVKIERHYSKDQILEQYLNTIYFGEGAWECRTPPGRISGKRQRN